MIPNIHIGQTELYLIPLVSYCVYALVGASINFFYQLYTISSKKKSEFNWVVFFNENWLSTLSGLALSTLIIIGAIFTGYIGLENSFTNNALALTLGYGVDGAITYYFDHIIKK